ncbi:MAG: TetR/AcrR family transcriptional regulator [Chloroflexi bacterium]|nr:TetR/AcrR family transcriptional regulator [Chloroflexota bacterium]
MIQKQTTAEAHKFQRGLPEERQVQIVEAATRCFQHKGYEKTTIDDIAAECDLSKGGIYWHYSSKKDILIAVFEYMISGLFKAYEVQALQEISPKRMLINIIRLYIETMLKNYEACRSFVVLMGVAHGDEDLRNMASEIYKQAEQQAVDILKQGEAAGEFVVPNKKVMAQIAIATGEGLLTRQMLTEDLDMDQIERELEAMLETFLNFNSTNDCD